MDNFIPDTIVQATIDRFVNRAKFGFTKYNTDLDRKDLSPDKWATHILEELHDSMLYIQKWQQEQEKMKELIHLFFIVYNKGIDGLTNEETMNFNNLKNWYKEHTK